MKIRKMILSIILSLLSLVVAQILSQLVASIAVLVKIPSFIANILAGILYVVFAYLLIKLLCEKYIKGNMSDYNIPSFKVEMKWCAVAVLLPLIITAFYDAGVKTWSNPCLTSPPDLENLILYSNL